MKKGKEPNKESTVLLKEITAFISVISLLASTTCYSQDIDGKIDIVGKKYKELPLVLFNKNQVVYYMDRGKLAFDSEDYSLAANYFDKAIANIEKVYSSHPDAINARKLFHEEKEKPFKGETYERAMVYYYRGLLDLINHDYENARASFESGLLQDSMGQTKDYLQDFATLEYLSGWSARCAGFNDLSKESFARAKKLNPMLTEPSKKKKTLIIGESGIVPFKYYNPEVGGGLNYWQHPYDALTYGQMKYGKTAIPLSDEIYYQARTRGARIADQIAYDKANTKYTAVDLSNLSQDISDTAFEYMDVANAIVPLSGVVVGAVGIVGMITSGALSEFSDAIEVGVDIRQWKTLPNRLYLTSSSNPAKKVTKYIKFVDEYGNQLSHETSILANKGKCQLVRATNLELSHAQLASWEEIQLKLSARAYPIYQTPKYWAEVKDEK